jgi:hypothetical protein
LFSQPPKGVEFDLFNNLDMDISEFLNNRRFLLFQTTQTHKSQISCKKEHIARRPPKEWVNCRKLSEMFCRSTDQNQIQDWTNQRSKRAKGAGVNENMPNWLDPATVGHAEMGCWSDNTSGHQICFCWQPVTHPRVSKQTLTSLWAPVCMIRVGCVFVNIDYPICIKHRRLVLY